MILPGYQTSDSAVVQNFSTALLVALVSCSSNFHHWPLLALIVALMLHLGDSADLKFAILYIIIALAWSQVSSASLLTVAVEQQDAVTVSSLEPG